MGSPYATDYTYDGDPGTERAAFPTDYTIKHPPEVDHVEPEEADPDPEV